MPLTFYYFFQGHNALKSTLPAGELPKNMNTNKFHNVPAASIVTETASITMESPRKDHDNKQEEAQRHFDTIY